MEGRGKAKYELIQNFIFKILACISLSEPFLQECSDISNLFDMN